MKRTLSVVFSVIVLASIAFVSSPVEDVHREKCPPQAGQIKIALSEGVLQGNAEVPIVYCPDLNVQVSGGSSYPAPVILNARIHHGILLISAYLLQPAKGPVDISIWWEVQAGDP